jgi:hypothetical protein
LPCSSVIQAIAKISQRCAAVSETSNPERKYYPSPSICREQCKSGHTPGSVKSIKTAVSTAMQRRASYSTALQALHTTARRHALRLRTVDKRFRPARDHDVPLHAPLTKFRPHLSQKVRGTPSATLAALRKLATHKLLSLASSCPPIPPRPHHVVPKHVRTPPPLPVQSGPAERNWSHIGRWRRPQSPAGPVGRREPLGWSAVAHEMVTASRVPPRAAAAAAAAPLPPLAHAASARCRPLTHPPVA